MNRANLIPDDILVWNCLLGCRVEQSERQVTDNTQVDSSIVRDADCLAGRRSFLIGGRSYRLLY